MLHAGKVVGKADFRSKLRSLGLRAEDAKIDEMFDHLDTDRSGALDAGEIRRALRRLRETAEQTTADLKGLKKVALEAARAARKVQAEFRKLKLLDDVAAAEAETRAKRAAEARTAADEVAKAARLALAKERAAAAAATAAEFKARVAAKRGAGGGAASAAPGGPPQAQVQITAADPDKAVDALEVVDLTG